uniref:DUF1618 domain-containing protein n=1 Tax=Oryza meridionalis TaxID=40149 RepID=A0A0E0F326_9ORYZ
MATAGGGSYPRWVMLEHKGHDVRSLRKHSAAGYTGDPKTAASACTSFGGPCVRVSFCLEAPPAASRMFFDLEQKDLDASMFVAAAHGDSMLIKMEYYDEHNADDALDYFVYNAGDAARPPSLTLLPHNYVDATEQDEPNPDMDVRATGILRRGDDELVVAELITKGSDDDMPPNEAKLLLLRSGEWSLKRAPIIHDDGGGGKGAELSAWETDMVVPVGDRRLCWVDLHRGVMLCDPFDESPRLQYVSLPVEPPKSFDDGRRDSRATKRSVCAAAATTGGGHALKFVDVTPRCCCGSRGTTTCDHSLNAFIITTWALMIDGDGDMSSWTMDAMIDATELWSLDAYAKARLPRVLPEFPVAGMDDDSPHHVTFVVRHPRRHEDDSDITSLIELDTRRKTLLSLCRYYEKQPGRPSCSKTYYRPSSISDHLKLLPSSSNGLRMRMDFERNLDRCSSSSDEPSAKRLKMSSSEVVVSSSSSSSPEEILAALKGILPELDCDELLRAYSILCHDNGRRFRSLLGLPMSLRKKWLLMEIKASEACSNCSACRADMEHELTPPILSPAQPPSLPSAAGGGYPPWVILRNSGSYEGRHGGEDDDLIPDANTAAASQTSTGLHITVSFSLAAPPSPSLMWFRCARGADSESSCNCRVIAAHGDSVLIKVSRLPPRLQRRPLRLQGISRRRRRRRRPLAGTGTAAVAYFAFHNAIGMLRRGEDDLVVAELTVERRPDTPRLEEAKLLVFRSGEWSVKRAPISRGSSGSSRELSAPWENDMAVPVGDRLLCYVDLHHGVIIVSDVFGDRDPGHPRLRYVPFPVDPPIKSLQADEDSRGCPNVSRTVGAVVTGDGGGAALKFVDISPRCCCGSLGKYTTCDRSSQAFAIRTWTLRIHHLRDMAWEMDAMIDATELWSLDAYAGLPLARPEYPAVSMDDPHLICVAVTGVRQEGGRTYYADGDSSLIMVDTRRKTIRSVPPFVQWPRHMSKTLLSSFSSYFNPNQSSNNGGGRGASPTKTHRHHRATNKRRHYHNGGGGYPRWVILDHYGEREGERRDEEADANTAAVSRTYPFTVSFCLAAPPALSALRFQFPGGDRAYSGPGPISFVIAAHADSALIGDSYELDFPHRMHGLDYFVYRARAAGADASRPPSLSILPPCYLTDEA